MANEKKFLAAAKKGDIDAIWELAGVGAEADEDDDDDDEGDGEEGDVGEADELAYKWLLVAADFGHAAASEAADDMLETSSLRYDDGALVQGVIELELGVAYLMGTDGVPANHEHATTHLQQAAALDVHNTTDAADGFPEIRRSLSPEARAVFDAVFPA